MAVWNKLFKRELLNNIFFKNTSCEDMEFLSRVYHNVKTGVLLDSHLYNYVKRPGSITAGGVSLKNGGEIETMIRVLNNLKISQKQERAYCLLQIYNLIPILKKLSKKTKYQGEISKICKKTISATLFEFLTNRKIKLIRKIGMMTFIYMPFSYKWFLKIKAYIG